MWSSELLFTILSSTESKCDMNIGPTVGILDITDFIVEEFPSSSSLL